MKKKNLTKEGTHNINNINYKSRQGCVEMHVSINTPIADANSVMNMAMADNLMSAIQEEVFMTNRFEDPVNQPIFLN